MWDITPYTLLLYHAVSLTPCNHMQSHWHTRSYHRGEAGNPANKPATFEALLTCPLLFTMPRRIRSGEAPQDETLRWFFQRKCPRPKVHERADKLSASPFYSFMTHFWLIYDQVLFVGPVDWPVNCRKYRQVLKHTWNAHMSEMIRPYQELPRSAKNL